MLFRSIIPREGYGEVERLAGQGSTLHKKHRLYLQHVGIVTPPENYASRLVRMFRSAGWRRLKLYALDPHDLALSKLERNAERDREDILHLAAAGHLNPNVLKERYQAELRPYLLARPAWHDQTLELWLAMCWPAPGPR